MTSLELRKEIGLERKLTALEDEFSYWLGLSQLHEKFEKHHTQLLALTGHLAGLRSQTQKAFDQIRQQQDILAEARQLEALILGIRRIWEFFRNKLIQRWDPELMRFLQLADELAWSCYRPALELSQSPRREPPLVFLNGGISPFALSRDRAFIAEEVPGQPLVGRSYDAVLRHLPFAVIGVPWYQTAHLPDLPVVAHETGHAVEQNFGLHDEVVSTIKRKLAGSARLPAWEAWSEEVFADIWGSLTLGPAFVSSLSDFLASSRAEIENEVANESGKYPTANLRIRLCRQVLDRMGFQENAKSMFEEWSKNFAGDGMSEDYAKEAADVANAILDASFAGFAGTGPLLEISQIKFSADDDKYAREGAKERAEGANAQSANTATRLVAAARYLYDQDPASYTVNRYNEDLITDASAIIKPGTRSGERLLDDGEKQDLATTARAQGNAWFDDFARWANPA